jgi:hypothetical protein
MYHAFSPPLDLGLKSSMHPARWMKNAYRITNPGSFIVYLRDIFESRYQVLLKLGYGRSCSRDVMFVIT